MMLSNYLSIKSESDRMTKADENSSNSIKKDLFIGIIKGFLLGVVIAVTFDIISLQTSNNNNQLIIPRLWSHVTVEQTDLIEEKYAKSHDVDIISNTQISAALDSYDWDGKSTMADLSDGNIVAIRHAGYSSLLKNPSSSNKVKLSATYNSDRNLWLVGYSSSKKAYTFRNLEDNCYLQHASGDLKCLSSLNNKGYWKWTSDVSKYENDVSGYKRWYTNIENYDSNKCPRALSVEDDVLEMHSNCNVVNSGFVFEIVKQ